ncbi:hypothetical protein C8Q79DRAFT_559800 [Trametes meyenii]|nr:hypothetical protein C8Q79DRAFT_559800 [Trametes meyenii]
MDSVNEGCQATRRATAIVRISSSVRIKRGYAAFFRLLYGTIFCVDVLVNNLRKVATVSKTYHRSEGLLPLFAAADSGGVGARFGRCKKTLRPSYAMAITQVRRCRSSHRVDCEYSERRGKSFCSLLMFGERQGGGAPASKLGPFQSPVVERRESREKARGQREGCTERRVGIGVAAEALRGRRPRRSRTPAYSIGQNKASNEPEDVHTAQDLPRAQRTSPSWRYGAWPWAAAKKP